MKVGCCSSLVARFPKPKRVVIVDHNMSNTSTRQSTGDVVHKAVVLFLPESRGKKIYKRRWPPTRGQLTIATIATSERISQQSPAKSETCYLHTRVPSHMGCSMMSEGHLSSQVPVSAMAPG